MKRGLHFALGLAISIVAIWYSMRGVSLPRVIEALRQSNLLLFAGVMGLTLFSFWLRALRWRSLLAAPRQASLDSLFSATMIGFMANNVLPLRLGEFVRAWALARREKCSGTMVLATVVVERAVDMLTLLGILALTLLVHPIEAHSEAGRSIRGGAIALILLTILLTLVLVLLERTPTAARRLVHALVRWLPVRYRTKLEVMLDHFMEGLSLFRDVPRLLWVFLLSFIMFGCFGVALQWSLEALSIHLPWYAGFTLLVITAIAIMAPAAPGYVGTMNAACVMGLTLFGFRSRDVASSFSWFYWAAQWLPVTVVGLYYLRREGLSLASLNRAQEVTT